MEHAASKGQFAHTAQHRVNAKLVQTQHYISSSPCVCKPERLGQMMQGRCYVYIAALTLWCMCEQALTYQFPRHTLLKNELLPRYRDAHTKVHFN